MAAPSRAAFSPPTKISIRWRSTTSSRLSSTWVRCGSLLNNVAPFKPTTGEQYEGGVKYQPPGYNMLFTAAVYNLKQENVLSALSGPGIPPNTTAQVGEVTSRGFEGS